MTTLKDLWENRGISPTQLAAQAGITTPTLYKMNKKERVAAASIVSVCKALGITRKQYDELDKGGPS